jgi:uncharacterized protein
MAKRKGKKRSRVKRSFPFLQKIGIGTGSLLLWLTAAGITLLALLLAVRLPAPQSGVQVTDPPPHVAKPLPRTPPVAGPAAVKPSPAPASPYSGFKEETPLQSIEQRAREIDLTILQAMITAGVAANDLKHREVQVLYEQGRSYDHQTLLITIAGQEEQFLNSLRSGLARFVKEADLRRDGQRKGEWEILVKGLPTHRLVFGHGSAPAPPAGPAQEAKLVIIIDDLGESVQDARSLAQLPFPVTFSVLPHNTRTAEVVEFARAHGKELLLHLPMEPFGFPLVANPGPGALFVGMSDHDLLDILEENLGQVPGAVGVNNHMGSRFTEDTDGMRIVMSELRRRNMFFLDSMTSPRSVAPALSRELQMPVLRRDVFLDNVQDVDLIVFQLQKAEKLALSRGLAIAIGHPYPETIQALHKWGGIKNGRIQISSIRSISSPHMVASGKELP